MADLIGFYSHRNIQCQKTCLWLAPWYMVSLLTCPCCFSCFGSSFESIPAIKKNYLKNFISSQTLILKSRKKKCHLKKSFKFKEHIKIYKTKELTRYELTVQKNEWFLLKFRKNFTCVCVCVCVWKQYR